jgi:hypothetical protein
MQGDDVLNVLLHAIAKQHPPVVVLLFFPNLN